MALSYKFFIDPFGELGDLTPIPDDTQPSGSVSYEQGFGPNYELILGTDPGALPVPRDQFNQLMNDITLAIQQYQTVGIPEFIEATDNDGSPYPYAIYAQVRYNDGSGIKVYESQIDNNTTDPTNTANWSVISDGSSAVYIPSASFDGSVSNGNMVAWDPIGQVFTRAIADGSALQNLIGRAEITASQSRVMLLGTALGYGGLTPGAVYYLSNTTLGQITANPANRNNLVRVGIAKDASSLYFRPAFINNYRSQTSTTSGSFVVPINVTQVFATLVGGGGGGGGSGGVPTNSSSRAAGGGGGGGGGANVIKVPISVTPLETLTLTVGIGGVGGTAGTSSVNGGNGTNGGVTSILRGVTTLATAVGGIGGNGSPAGGIGGSSSGGDGGNSGGGSGSPGIITAASPGITESWGGQGGMGGDSILGIGARGAKGSVVNNGSPGQNAGAPGSGYGGGGGGASGGNSISTAADGAIGGNGAPGVIVLEW